MSSKTPIRVANEALESQKDLPTELAVSAFKQITNEGADTEEIKRFLVNLKNPSAEILVSFAKIMSDKADKISVSEYAVDISGIGGHKSNWLSIPLASAFVVAACGVVVAKYGDRGVFYKNGPADILETLGANIDLPPTQAERILNEVGISFLFAPNFCPVVRTVFEARKEISTPCLFDLLEPLTNPATIKRQLVGVLNKEQLDNISAAFLSLGHENTFVVNAESGAGVIDTLGKTSMYQVTKTRLYRRRTRSSDFGLAENKNEFLIADSMKRSIDLIKRVFAGEAKVHNSPPTQVRAARHAIAINAAAALVVAGAAHSFNEASQVALEAIDSGAVASKLKLFIEHSNK